MKKTSLFLILIFLISGCVKEEIVREEQISDGAKIIKSEGNYKGKEYERTDIKYEKDGKEFQSYFDPMLTSSLEWIKENAEGIFLSWWDYGHMIRGYAGKEVVIYSPSEEILWGLASGEWDEGKSGKFSPKEKVEDVASALATNDISKTMEIMQKYDSDYVFVTVRDSASSFVLFKIAGLEGYVDEDNQPAEKAASTTLFKMIKKEGVEGFELVYSDELVRIYKVQRLW